MCVVTTTDQSSYGVLRLRDIGGCSSAAYKSDLAPVSPDTLRGLQTEPPSSQRTPRLMRFIPTADWPLSKPLGRFDTLGKAAVGYGAGHDLVSGDVSTPSR